jgi:hypothetical protein
MLFLVIKVLFEGGQCPPFVLFSLLMDSKCLPRILLKLKLPS